MDLVELKQKWYEANQLFQDTHFIKKHGFKLWFECLTSWQKFLVLSTILLATVIVFATVLYIL
jgi:hypothetical protein